MQIKLTTLVGFKLPVYTISTLALLILVSFTNCNARFLTIIDKLILVTIVLIPIVLALGVIVWIIAVVKFRSKRIPLIGVVLNVLLLVVLLCFIKPFLVEFKFLI